MKTRHSYTTIARGSTFGVVAALFWLTSALSQPIAESETPEIPRDSAIAESLDGGWFGGSQAYEFCMGRVENEPEEAFERALSWENQGGGPPARHCGAVALIGLELFAEAADRLDTMAQNPANGLDANIRAQLLLQAANAWMMEGFPLQAVESLRAAEALEPSGIRLMVNIHFDRARAYVMDNDWRMAIESLDQALLIAPFAQDALVLRATGHRVLGQMEAAQADLTRILEDDAEFTPALLERGVMWRLEGNDDAARRDWIRVLMLEPEGELADAARSYLHNLDFPGGMGD